jgi:hypothetical protein
MANQECNLNNTEVWYCFENVRKLIAAIPAEIFEGNLREKKECADKGLEELEKFISKWKDIKKEDLKEFAGIKDKLKGLLYMVCGQTRPTVPASFPGFPGSGS